MLTLLNPIDTALTNRKTHMNLLFSEYLSPTNPIASGIVTLLKYLFFLWFAGLIVRFFWLLTKQKQISRNEDVQVLVNARREQESGLEESDRKARAETTFSDFCEKQSLRENTPVASHLKSIFLAGWNESRLEVSELINLTTSNLFKWNGLFRSVLAVFIVIGLLGTLFGLTDSLTQLSPALETSVTDETSIGNSEEITQALSRLLREMKSALAPSILGIIFTVLGIILYNVYLQLACLPVESTLERLTLTVWIPQLYPTTSQRLIQTLQESEQQMRSGYQTATQVGELVGTVQNNISDFNENLSRANEITQPLSESVSQINIAADVLNEAFAEKLKEFLQQFTERLTLLTDFQVQVQNLYQQLKDESDTFQHGANQKLDTQNQKMEEQTQNLVKTLNALENYQRIYIASCEQISVTLEENLNQILGINASINATNRQFLEDTHITNRQLFEEINTTNREWIKEIQVQLTADLAVIQPTLETHTNEFTTNLKNLQNSLDKQLETLNNQLDNFNAPLRETAEQIRGIFQGFVDFMRGIVGDLQVELKTQNEKYKSQLEASKDLNQQIIALLKQLAENSKNQSAAVSTLSSNVSNLTQGTEKLSTEIQSFTSGIGEFSASAGEISRHSKTLADSAERLARQSSFPSQRSSEDIRKNPLLKRIWNTLWRKKGS